MFKKETRSEAYPRGSPHLLLEGSQSADLMGAACCIMAASSRRATSQIHTTLGMLSQRVIM